MMFLYNNSGQAEKCNIKELVRKGAKSLGEVDQKRCEDLLPKCDWCDSILSLSLAQVLVLENVACPESKE